MALLLNSGLVTVAGDGSATWIGSPPTMIGDQPVWYPPVSPEAPLGGEETPDLKIAKFGNGYVARSPAGMNHIASKRTLVFGMLRPGIKDQVLGFLRDRGGYQPFWYQIPGDALRRWVSPTWSPEIKSYEVWSVTVALELDWTPIGI